MIPSNIDCGGDYLKIYNYQNKETQSEVASICGSDTEVVTSDTNSVYIIFTSDASITASGFKIRYSWKSVPKGMIHSMFNSVGRAKSICFATRRNNQSTHFTKSLQLQWNNMVKCMFVLKQYTCHRMLHITMHGHFGISCTVFSMVQIIHFKQTATRSHRWLTFMPTISSFRRPARVCPWPFSVLFLHNVNESND